MERRIVREQPEAVRMTKHESAVLTGSDQGERSEDTTYRFGGGNQMFRFGQGNQMFRFGQGNQFFRLG
jgi:hypothetical protein